MVMLRKFLVLIVLIGVVGAKFSEDDISHLARLLKLGTGTGQQTKGSRELHALSDVKREKKENLDEKLQQIKHEFLRPLVNKISQKRWIENDSSVRGTSPPPNRTYLPSPSTTSSTAATTTTTNTELPGNLVDFWKHFWRLHRILFR